MKNPKEFWEEHHGKKTRLWLTGSTLARLCSVHKIDKPKDKVVLEIGVGLGHATRELTKDNRVIAVDISQNALDNLRDSGVINRFLTQNMTQIPDSSVDFAICHLVFQHCEDDAIQFILKHTICALKPGGVFILQSGDSKAPVGANVARTQNRTLIWHTPEEIKGMIAEAGGEVLSEEFSQMTSDIYWQLLKITKNI